MKSFIKYCNDEKKKEYEWCTIIAEKETIHILINTKDTTILNEAKYRGKPVGGKYSIQFHKAHSIAGQDHITAYARNNKLFALNVDGSAHDQSHGVKIPNKLAKAISQQYPDFDLPKDNIIEWASKADQMFAINLLFG